MDPINHKTSWNIASIKNSEFKLKKMRGFWHSLLLFMWFFRKHFTKILRPILLPPLSMLFPSIWDSFFAQALMLLLFQDAAILSRGRWRREALFISGKWNIPEFPDFLQELTWSQYIMRDIVTKIEEVRYIKAVVTWFSTNS